MNRKSFFKKLGIGVGVAVTAPKMILANLEKAPQKVERPAKSGDTLSFVKPGEFEIGDMVESLDGGVFLVCRKDKYLAEMKPLKKHPKYDLRRVFIATPDKYKNFIKIGSRHYE